MTTEENDIEDVNGFAYGQLEGDIGDKNEGSSGCLKSVKLCGSYLHLGKNEIWLKIKEVYRKYANEYRIGVFIVLMIILFCFFILLHLSLQVGVGSNKQNKGNTNAINIIIPAKS